MANQNFPNAEAFCRFIWHSYLVERNYGLVGELIDSKMTSIGTGAHEVSRNMEEFVNQMQIESSQWDGTFVIKDEWYHTTQVSETIFNVIGEIQLQETPENKIIYDFFSRFTLLVEHGENGWRVLHVHQSVPDASQGCDEFFPHRIIEQSNRELEKKIKEKTLELEQSNRKVIYYSRHDYLTDLMNRQYLEERIADVFSAYPCGALIMLDVDNFKGCNDHYGHLFGDKVLMLLAESLRSAFPNQIIGRIGGDEFIVYVPYQSEEEARRQTKQYIRQLWNHWNEAQRGLSVDFTITISAGAALYPAQGDTYHNLWQAADQALYQAKNSGRNRMIFA